MAASTRSLVLNVDVSPIWGWTGFKEGAQTEYCAHCFDCSNANCLQCLYNGSRELRAWCTLVSRPLSPDCLLAYPLGAALGLRTFAFRFLSCRIRSPCHRKPLASRSIGFVSTSRPTLSTLAPRCSTCSRPRFHVERSPCQEHMVVTRRLV